MWKRTIIANLVGAAVLLLGLALHSNPLLLVGFGILVVCVCYMIAAMVKARASRNGRTQRRGPATVRRTWAHTQVMIEG
jgi:membrane protein implicated in regulation of membrane protease activity